MVNLPPVLHLLQPAKQGVFREGQRAGCETGVNVAQRGVQGYLPFLSILSVRHRSTLTP